MSVLLVLLLVAPVSLGQGDFQSQQNAAPERLSDPMLFSDHFSDFAAPPPQEFMIEVDFFDDGNNTNDNQSWAITNQSDFLYATEDEYNYLSSLIEGIIELAYDYEIVNSGSSGSNFQLDQGGEDLCDGTFPICYKDNIHLCKDNIRFNETKILHNCRFQGCTACPAGVDLCNDEMGRSRCEAATSDRHVTTCLPAKQDQVYCTGSDVRYCNSSNLAVLVEYCDNRGCQNKPLSCLSLQRQAAPYLSSAIVKPGKAKGKLAKGKVKPVIVAQGTPVATAPVIAAQGTSADATATTTTANQQGSTAVSSAGASSSGPSSSESSSGSSGSSALESSGSSGSGSSSGSSGTRTRVEWSAMPDADRQKYVQAVVQLYKNGDMQKFAQTHYDNRDQIHGNGNVHFLIWHRVALMDFEERLRALPGMSSVTVPYWTYDYSSSPSDRRSIFGTTNSRLGQADHDGCIGGAFDGITHTLQGAPSCIRRTPDISMFPQLSNSIFTDLAQLSSPDLMTFSNNLQNAHGYPHVAMGATFATHYSPIDPLFFTHHSNIDRLWDIWQNCHQSNEWIEAQGLATPIVAYPGVTAKDFINNSAITWKGKQYSVRYGGGQLNDPSQFSSDFRRRIATACQGGTLQGVDNPPQPILGIDSSWATGTGAAAGVTPSNLKPTDVPLKCAQSSGSSDYNSLKVSPIGVYDNQPISGCIARCSQFWWKQSGPSNCVCVTGAGSRGSSGLLSSGVNVNNYVPSCDGGLTNYGLYSAPSGTGSGSGRRLLQAGDLSGAPISAGTSAGVGSSGVPMVSSPIGGTTIDSGATLAAPPVDSTLGGSSASTTSQTTQGGGTSSSGFDASAAAGPVSLGSVPTDAPAAADSSSSSLSESNSSNSLESASSNATTSNSSEFIFNSSSSDSAATSDDENNSTDTDAAENATSTSTLASSADNETDTSNSTDTSGNSTKVCFSIPPGGASAGNITSPVACSSASVTPKPLPREWMEMNKLKLDDADLCKTFKPSTATKNFDCINQG